MLENEQFQKPDPVKLCTSQSRLYPLGSSEGPAMQAGINCCCSARQACTKTC